MALEIQDCLGPAGFYEEHGEGVVILIHGLTGTPAEMRYLAKSLVKQGFSVACPQLAGHCGDSDDLKKTNWQDWYASVDRTFEALKLKHKHVYAAGLCVGALLAIRLAAEKGLRVNGIGLLSTIFFYDGWNMPKAHRKILLAIAVYSPLVHFLSWKERPPYGLKCERTQALVHETLQNRKALSTKKEGAYDTYGVTFREHIRLINATKKVLKNVQSPTLLIHSLEDDMASIKNTRYVASHIASHNIEMFFIEDSYHAIVLDKQKDKVAKRVGAFFNHCSLSTN